MTPSDTLETSLSSSSPSALVKKEWLRTDLAKQSLNDKLKNSKMYISEKRKKGLPSIGNKFPHLQESVIGRTSFFFNFLFFFFFSFKTKYYRLLIAPGAEITSLKHLKCLYLLIPHTMFTL